MGQREVLISRFNLHGCSERLKRLPTRVHPNRYVYRMYLYHSWARAPRVAIMSAQRSAAQYSTAAPLWDRFSTKYVIP